MSRTDESSVKRGRKLIMKLRERETIAAFLIKSALGAINSTNFKAFRMFAASKRFFSLYVILLKMPLYWLVLFGIEDENKNQENFSLCAYTKK